MTDFTPGPWRTGDSANTFIVKGRNPAIWIGRAFSKDVGAVEAGANARLMASAPDLCRRLEDARKAIASLPEGALGWEHDAGESSWPIRDELLSRIDAALRKAKGEGDDGKG